MNSIYFNHFNPKNKQFKIAITFLTGYGGIFKKKQKNEKVFFTVIINDDDFNLTFFPPGAYEPDSPDDEIKRNTVEDGYFTEENYPVIFKPKFQLWVVL